MLVRKCEDLSTFCWAFVQLKMAKSADVAKASRSVGPALLLHLHTNRVTAPTSLGEFDKMYLALHRRPAG